MSSMFNRVRTLLTPQNQRQSAQIPDRAALEWMRRLNREIPDLNTLMQRLEIVEQLKADINELGTKIQDFGALYERIRVDYASLLESDYDETDTAEIMEAEVLPTPSPVRARVIRQHPVQGVSRCNGRVAGGASHYRVRR